MINKKIKSALEEGIRPILCVGETLEQKDAGQTKDIVKQQLLEATQDIDTNLIDVAYEPVWAISPGRILSKDEIRIPTKEEIADIHGFIRELLHNTTSRILFGGSSNDENAPELIQLPEVNGFLVGGASLNPAKFASMIASIAKYLKA